MTRAEQIEQAARALDAHWRALSQDDDLDREQVLRDALRAALALPPDPPGHDHDACIEAHEAGRREGIRVGAEAQRDADRAFYALVSSVRGNETQAAAIRDLAPDLPPLVPLPGAKEGDR